MCNLMYCCMCFVRQVKGNPQQRGKPQHPETWCSKGAGRSQKEADGSKGSRAATQGFGQRIGCSDIYCMSCAISEFICHKHLAFRCLLFSIILHRKTSYVTYLDTKHIFVMHLAVKSATSITMRNVEAFDAPVNYCCVHVDWFLTKYINNLHFV